MKKAISWLIISWFIIILSVYAQVNTASYGTTVTSFNTSSTGVVTGTTFAVPAQYAVMISWQVIADGSALSVNLEGSLDNSSWFTVDSQTNATGGLRTFGFSSIKFVRCSQVSRTGGTNTRCTLTTSRAYTGITPTAKPLVSSTSPTVASGFGTSPAIIANGTAAFILNVGSGGTATQGVLTMPAAVTGWLCHVNNMTAANAHVAYNTRQIGASSTSVTLENQTTSTGAAIAWGANDILRVSCFAY